MSGDDFERMLRSLPLRQPSRHLNDRVMGELRGARSPRWSGWVSMASAAAAMLALGLSIPAFLRTLPPSEPVYRGSTVEERVNGGRPAHSREVREPDSQATPAGASQDRSVEGTPRFREDLLRRPFSEPLGQPTKGRFHELRPGGVAPINPANGGEPSQVQ